MWSPDGAHKLPVIVWVHRGEFRTGATEMPLFNGQRLAEQGAVVVTVNYRLGALGLLAHPDLTDPGNGSWANWQLQDMAAALNWGRENIVEFGDWLLRNYGTRYAETIAAAGAEVRYGTFMHPVRAPGRGVPHCAELPLMFGTYGLDFYRDKVGAGPRGVAIVA